MIMLSLKGPLLLTLLHFQKIKTSLIKDAELAIPKTTHQFCESVDASWGGIGAVTFYPNQKKRNASTLIQFCFFKQSKTKTIHKRYKNVQLHFRWLFMNFQSLFRNFQLHFSKIRSHFAYFSPQKEFSRQVGTQLKLLYSVFSNWNSFTPQARF